MLKRAYLKIALLLLCSLSGAPQGFAAGDPILYGPEFTFAQVQLVLKTKAVDQYKLQDQLIEKYKLWITEVCKTRGCSIIDKDGVLVLFDDGFFFHIGIDQNVLEAKADPVSAAEWKKRAPQVQELLFDAMAKIGLRPTSLFGSGHISIDKKAAFGDDVLRLRDFVVDYFNHPGLAEGIMEDDPYNARSFAQLGDHERQAFATLIDAVDRGEVKTIERFEDLLKENVLKGSKLRKGYALWFHKERVEVRAVQAQGVAEDFALQTELFDRRIQHLQKLRATGNPVKLIPNVGANHGWQSVSQFYYYATDAGMAWKDARKMMSSAKYKFMPGILNRESAFGKRNICIYFLKKLRADLFTKVGNIGLEW